MVRFCGFMDFRCRRPWREDDGFGVGQCKPGERDFGWSSGRKSRKAETGFNAEAQRRGDTKKRAGKIRCDRQGGKGSQRDGAAHHPNLWKVAPRRGGECRLAYGWKIRPETGISRLWRQAVATPMDGRSATGGVVIVTRQDNPGGSVVFHVDAG